MRTGRTKWYAGALDIPEGTSGKVTVRHLHHPAGAVLHSGNMRTAIYGQRGAKLTFPEPTRWHELSEDHHGVWMTDLPIEQRQMDALIEKAHGRVLVGGLGVGYAVVALATKPRVKEIVVVERSKDIIHLVWDATLAKVGDRVKCSVVHEDLFKYLKGRSSFYQWGLFDIWQSDGENTFHTVVTPLRALAEGMVRTVECWNEDIMRGQLFQGLQSRLFLLHSAVPGLSDGITVDALCKDTENIYQQWAVPFWRWYREHKDQLTAEALSHAMSRYAQCYGRPELKHEALLPVRRLVQLFGKVEAVSA